MASTSPNFQIFFNAKRAKALNNLIYLFKSQYKVNVGLALNT